MIDKHLQVLELIDYSFYIASYKQYKEGSQKLPAYRDNYRKIEQHLISCDPCLIKLQDIQYIKGNFDSVLESLSLHPGDDNRSVVLSIIEEVKKAKNKVGNQLITFLEIIEKEIAEGILQISSHLTQSIVETAGESLKDMVEIFSNIDLIDHKIEFKNGQLTLSLNGHVDYDKAIVIGSGNFFHGQIKRLASSSDPAMTIVNFEIPKMGKNDCFIYFYNS